MSTLQHRPTQTARIVGLLRSRSPHWVSLREILELRISQYSARIHQARHRWGLNIENRVENVNGKKHSWFRLVEDNQPVPMPEVGDIYPTRLSAVGGYTPAFPQFGAMAKESYGVD